LDQSNHSNKICIDDSCEISPERVEVFTALIRKLSLASLPTSAEHLKGLLVVPDTDLERTVNAIAEGKRPAPYRAGTTLPPAIAVAVEDDSGLSCFIVITESLLQSIDPEHYTVDTVSTLLEELLHVRLYIGTWQRRGCLMSRKTESPCAQDLFVMCSNFHDEYVVARWKAPIFASLGLEIRYGLRLAPILDQAAQNLARIVIMASSGVFPIQDAWGKVIRSVHRDLFDPLARDAGFRAGNPESSQDEDGASESWFYRDHIASYWQQVQVELERSFDSGLTETESALDEIVKTVEEFLRFIGVTYRDIDDSQCWVNFERRFFDSLED